MIRHFHVVIVLQLDLRDHFELGGEAQRLAVVEVDVLDIGLADHVEVFGLELLLEILGDQVLQHLLPDVAGELLADQRYRGLARAKTREFGALLDIQHNAFGLAGHFGNGNGNLQRVLATFN